MENSTFRDGRRRTALVIGATGGIGGETAKALLAHNWTVLALSRNPEEARRRTGWIGELQFIKGDAAIEHDVIAAAKAARIIVHAANPPYYKNWRGLAIPMLKNAIAAARVSGARLVLPGNIYNFGPDVFPVVHEMSPQNPISRKGAVRVEMEAMLRDAQADRVRSLIVRAGEYFGSHQPSSMLRDLMIKPGRAVRSVTYPGDFKAGHAWCYTPDLAEAIARLAEIEGDLPAFDTFNFGGHWIERGVDFADAVRRAGGAPHAPIRRAPWVLFRAASPFVRLLREMMEMRYLWQVPVRLDNSKLVATIGPEPHTDLDVALHQVLLDLGCLAARQLQAA